MIESRASYRRSRSRVELGLGLGLGLALVAAWGVGGCARGLEPLMETPVLYVDGRIDPFGHLEEHERVPRIRVFYATDRAPWRKPFTAPTGSLPDPRASGVGSAGGSGIGIAGGANVGGGRGEGPTSGRSANRAYGNHVGDSLRVGTAEVAFGGEDMTWEELHRLSTSAERDRRVALRLVDVRELAELDRDRHDGDQDGLDARQRRFAEAIDAELARCRDPEIFIYVHGAKTSFYRCTARAAEFAHFAGRDFVPIAFDWPSHPEIFSYAWGGDHGRARGASRSFESLIAFLAANTSARRIHLLCYSAGGITASEALASLRREYADLDSDELRERFRIGVVLFAAADVPTDHFLDLLPDLHDVSERVAVTVSDADEVLEVAAKFLAGGERVGSRDRSLSSSELHLIEQLPRAELIDVSHAKEERGFDIGGHHYWYRHPWVAADCILNIRTDRDPEGRGLLPTHDPRVYHLPPDYPDRALEAARRALESDW